MDYPPTLNTAIREGLFLGYYRFSAFALWIIVVPVRLLEIKFFSFEHNISLDLIPHHFLVSKFDFAYRAYA